MLDAVLIPPFRHQVRQMCVHRLIWPPEMYLSGTQEPHTGV